VTEEVLARLEGGRGVVTSAPDEALISAEMVAEIACGRGNDTVVDYGGAGAVLILGVDGMGVGRVTYKIGELDRDESTYPLKLQGEHVTEAD
jgi:hypothetical protein